MRNVWAGVMTIGLVAGLAACFDGQPGILRDPLVQDADLVDAAQYPRIFEIVVHASFDSVFSALSQPSAISSPQRG